jgi:NADPH-dependent 2,4-dienoyl-CoA reductase/sulfur reductase-like enzyme
MRTGLKLRCRTERPVRADAVVAGLGVTPKHRRWPSAPALRVDNGIVVDEQLRSSDADIFAAGDVANFHNAALDLRQRVEHENAAISMGGHAGRAMTGAGEAYTLLPYFYSDLFDLGYEAVGLLDDRLDVVENWTVPYRKASSTTSTTDACAACCLWNVWGRSMRRAS